MKYCSAETENGLCDWAVYGYCCWYMTALIKKNGKLLCCNECQKERR